MFILSIIFTILFAFLLQIFFQLSTQDAMSTQDAFGTFFNISWRLNSFIHQAIKNGLDSFKLFNIS
jgi:hypothetical protein